MKGLKKIVSLKLILDTDYETKTQNAKFCKIIGVKSKLSNSLLIYANNTGYFLSLVELGAKMLIVLRDKI